MIHHNHLFEKKEASLLGLPETLVEGELITVSQLNNLSRRLLETHYASVWIQGEISNLARPASGHVYFTLKDERAQIRCALFRHRFLGPNAYLANGVEVIVRAKVTLYEERGDYQLLIEALSLAGEGALRQQFQALKKRLQQEGLFSRAKKAIPSHPTVIGVITSPTGAAIRDVLSVLQRRFPLAKVLIYPSAVQGTAATQALIEALKEAITHQQADVLLLVRGGGSLEDLWCFNEEALVRVVAQCPIPLVTGVGHETDTTLVDHASDQRAPTPSAAAELVSPDQAALLNQCLWLHKRLQQSLWLNLENAQQHLDHLTKRLTHPREQLRSMQEKNRMLHQRLLQALRYHLRQAEQRLAHHCQQLHQLSPLATLARGYSIIKSHQGQVISRTEQVAPGDQVEVLVQNGTLECTVTGPKDLRL